MLRTLFAVLCFSLLASASGCATLVGAGIGYAVNGDQGARRGAAAGAEIDAAMFAGAVASNARRNGAGRSMQTLHFRCQGLEFPSSSIELQRVYLSDALYDCEDELRQACRCEEIY